MKSKKIIKSSFYLMIIVLIGKVMGFLKQIVIAWKFGTTAGIDVYFTADSYISTFGQIIILSIPPAIVSTFMKMKTDKKEEKDNFVSSIFCFFILIGFFLIIFNILLSPFLSKILGISYSLEQQFNLTRYIIFLSPVILFSFAASVSSGILQSNNKFIQDKLLGIYLSISIIFFTVLFENKWNIDALLYGFLLGYFLFTAMMLILLWKNIKIKICNPFKNSKFRKFLKVLFPIIIGTSLVDFSHLIDKVIASSLPSGSVSSLYYSQIICSDLVNGVIISTIGVVLLPNLTGELENKNPKEILNNIFYILKITIPIVLFISLLYMVLGKEFISFVFERGKFDTKSTITVYECVIGYNIGLCFTMSKEIITKYLYALGDAISPMISNITSIITNIILSIILSKIIGVKGITYATSISIIISNIVLIYYLKKHISISNVINFKKIFEIIKLFVISVLTFLVGILIKNIIKLNQIYVLVISTIIMFLIFILFLKFLCKNLYNEYKKIIKKSL